MEGGFVKQNLLDLSAADDLSTFIRLVEDKSVGVNEVGFWYGRRIGSRKMGFEERTPLMIASMYGSTEVLKYILRTGKADVNRACGSDGATALHCAAAGGSNSSVEIVRLLIEAAADVNYVDASGNKPVDLIAPYIKSSTNLRRKALEAMLKGRGDYGVLDSISEAGFEEVEEPLPPTPKKEYPIDVPLPDINSGVYGSDEFRMYSFKYRTRLCKDETGCARKVCFFAHKHEELRPLYASTGSAMPSPKSGSVSSMDMAALSSLALGSSSLLMPTTSTPPMSPSVACSSPMGGNLWNSKVNLTPPALQLPGSRLKTATSARDMELEMELMELENIRTQQQQRQQLIDDLSSLSSPPMWNKDYNRFGELKPTNLDNVYGSLDTSLLSQMQGLSPKFSTATTTSHLQSPTGVQMRQNSNQLRSSYPSNLSSSPARRPPSTYGFDSSSAVAQAVMNSRSAAFAKRSQSFIDRGAVNHRPSYTTAANSAASMSSNLSDWSSPDGKLDWGYHGDDLNKLKKSASFGFRSGNAANIKAGVMQPNVDEPDVSWVHSLVKDVPSMGAGLYTSDQRHGGVHDRLPPWVEQLYIEQEQMVA
ncbi:hypothetical protein RJ639_001793 [Escallonia herrerae]|uniref:Uncharacterized protein n=1 Tax=Escallonia herrerae TaxID=1293975 RepID=A0AA89BS89_9ASTE|nr:hypothetical protein RJ639_001793 [Escallonia herrerae]